MYKDLLAQNFQREIWRVFFNPIIFIEKICKHVFAQYFQRKMSKHFVAQSSRKCASTFEPNIPKDKTCKHF
jgi:hypothetical protein